MIYQRKQLICEREMVVVAIYKAERLTYYLKVNYNQVNFVIGLRCIHEVKSHLKFGYLKLLQNTNLESGSLLVYFKFESVRYM